MEPEQQTKKPLPKKELSEDEQDKQDDQAIGRFFVIMVLVIVAQTLFKAFVSFVTASYIRMFVAAASVSLVVFACWKAFTASNHWDGKQGKSSSTHSAPSSTYRGQGAGTKYSTHQGTDTNAGAKKSTGRRATRDHSTRSRPGGRAKGDQADPSDWYASMYDKLYDLPELNPEQYMQHGNRYEKQHMDEINRRYRQEMDDIQRRHRNAINRNQLAFEELRYKREQQQRRQRQEEEERQWRHYQHSQRQERPRRSSRGRSKTHYDMLGVHSSATANEIRKAYKRKALEHHPDKGGSAATFRRVQTAYETLKDDQKRRKYDSDIRWGR
jgi:hypothetical protein